MSQPENPAVRWHPTLAQQLGNALNVHSLQDLLALEQRMQQAGLAAEAAELAVLAEEVSKTYLQFERQQQHNADELMLINRRLHDRSVQQAQDLAEAHAAVQELLRSYGDAAGPAADAAPGTERDTDPSTGDGLAALALMVRALVAQKEQAERTLADTENRFASLVQNLPGVVYRVEANDRLSTRLISDAVYAMTGYAPSEFVNGEVSLKTLVPVRDWARLRDLLHDAARHGRPYQYEAQIVRADGSRGWVMGMGQPVRDEAGRLVFDGLFLDHTQAKQASEDLRRTREMLDRAINSMDAGFALFDAQDRLQTCNLRFQEMYAVAGADKLHSGTPLADIFLALFRSGVKLSGRSLGEAAWVEQCLQAWNASEGAYEWRVGERWIRLSNTTTSDGMKVALHTDITAIKNLNLELTQAREAAEGASRAKSEFLANMSHELRTPLNGVIGMTGLVLATRLTDEQRDHLQLAKDSADSLLVVVNDILDLSKMEAGKLQIEKLGFALRPMLNACCAPLALRARDKGVALDIRIASDVPMAVESDPVRLRQLITNLVGNAVKFTETGSVTVQVERSTDQTMADGLQFSVIDTGIGIAHDKLAGVFEAFTQADSSTTRRFGGTGLGLAICTRLVKLMGGTLGVSSEVDVGSTFYFTLPAPAVVLTEALDSTPAPEPDTAGRTRAPTPVLDATSFVASSAVAAAPSAASAPSAPMALHPVAPRAANTLHVLLVEDHPINQKLAMVLLKRMGHTVSLAVNGKEAVEQSARERFDLILMDMQMPVMNGLDATIAIREREADRPEGSRPEHVPIVAMTANAMTGDRERCLQVGMDGYVSKPINPEVLAAEMARVLTVLASV
jgi:two-component system, sensor histidine kinase and response regulator